MPDKLRQEGCAGRIAPEGLHREWRIAVVSQLFFMVGKLFKNVVSQVQSGLLRAKAASKLSEEGLCSLPSVWDVEVRQRLRALPYPDSYLTAVADQIAEAIAAWQSDLDAPNNLVLLGSPVDNTAAVLDAALTADYAPELTASLDILRPLPWSIRPADPLLIETQLTEALARLQEAEPINDDDDPDDLARRHQVIVLPPLEQCYLRCIGGWRGIEWLRDTVNAQQNYFWVIPSNTWAWAFLNRVCQVEAYLNYTRPLPRLDRNALRDWITPLAETLGQPLSEEDESSSALGDVSWSTFADLCEGRPEVARALWLRSLRLQKSDRPEQPQLPDQGDPLPVPLRQVQPALPSLPDLEAADHYVIHALMLHGVTARSHLALSLGQPESIVQVRVQMLRQAGLLRLSQSGLGIHPAYYSRLFTELETNNFLTEENS
ncbi:MAG: hypothetical protein DCF17_14785 [Shackletoniella antarctica]|uniref:Uncharacterized protein n=1 Tax=Shackletoniella antarctica TaxID=268115 RepID=A0A2W4Y4Y6_9CYAN|nr:MAG: hypothetical protein DCF17_14785 [Shackletoniella antarctica]